MINRVRHNSANLVLRTTSNLVPQVIGRYQRFVQRGGLTLLAFLIAVGFIVPLFWLVLGSLKTTRELFAYPLIIFPDPTQWENYNRAVNDVPFWDYTRRSILLSASHTFLSVASSAFVGYGFARLRAPGRNALFALMLATVMIPNIVSIIPQYILYSRIGLIDTYWPWILWGLGGSPFHIFLFRQFFASFPKELEEAAQVDGANRLRIFLQIFLPNSIPVVAATAIFSFQWVWGDWFFQTLFLSDSKATLAMKMAQTYVDPRGNPQYTLTLAGVVLYMLPLVVVFFLAQRYIIRGIVTTGMKS